MDKSTFQYEDPSLIKLDFKINENFRRNKDKQTAIVSILNVRVATPKDVSNQAEVVLGIKINQDDCPFLLDAEMAAIFKWEDSIDKEQADQLLQHNAPALLLGFIRPIISYVTKCSPFTSFDIPYVDFTQDADEFSIVESDGKAINQS